MIQTSMLEGCASTRRSSAVYLALECKGPVARVPLQLRLAAPSSFVDCFAEAQRTHRIMLHDDVVAHLVARGRAVAQRHPELGSDTVHEQDRALVLAQSYTALARGAEGISLNVLRGLTSTHRSPADNLGKATLMLEQLDLNDDKMITQTEWLRGLTDATKHLCDEDFAHLERALQPCNFRFETDDRATLGKLDEPLNSIEFVQRTLARHLQLGLAAVAAKIASQHTSVASQQLWDADGHLPEKYVPFNAVRWLGEWLQEHNEFSLPITDDPRTLDWKNGIPQRELNLVQELKLAFYHLDEGTTGYVGSPQAEEMVATFLPKGSKETAADLLERMDMQGACDLDIEEFCEFARSGLVDLSPDVQRQAVWPYVCAYFLGTHTMGEQCRIVFEHLAGQMAQRAPEGVPDDLGGDNVSTASDSSVALEQQAKVEPPANQTIGLALVAGLARHVTGVLNPTALQAMLAGVPRSAQVLEVVEEAGFQTAVEHVCASACNSQTELADLLAPVLADRVQLDATADLEPLYAAHVRAQPLHAWVPPIAPGAVATLGEEHGVSEVLLLDCRTEDEYELSSIADATPCDMLEDPSSEHGWQVDQDCLDEVAEAVQEAIDMPTNGMPAVVTFCTDGSRAALVAVRLYERFPDVKIYTLCGGLIAWHNAGLPLEDAFGHAVAELHPHTDALAAFISDPPDSRGTM